MSSLTDDELLEMFRSVDSQIDKTLGMEFVEVSSSEGTCTLRYHIGKEFTGPLGAVFGGIQAAMLDAALSIAGTANSARDRANLKRRAARSWLVLEIRREARITLAHALHRVERGIADCAQPSVD